MSEVIQYAKKQRHAALLEKVKSGKALSPSELRELEAFEEMAKKQAKTKGTPTKKAESTPKLTPNQEAFCLDYVTDNNGTRAYKSIYKCSQKAAESGAARLLKVAKIQKKLADLRSAAVKRSEITLDRVIEEIAKVAFSSIRGCIDTEKNGIIFKSAKHIPDSLWDCIAEIAQLPGGRVKVKLYSKTRALESLKQYFVENPGNDETVKRIFKAPLAIKK